MHTVVYALRGYPTCPKHSTLFLRSRFARSEQNFQPNYAGKKKKKDLKLTQNCPVFYVSLCVEKRVPVVCMHFCYLQSRVSSILLIIITWFGHYSCHNRLFRLPNLAVCFSISTLYIWYSDSISEEYALSVRRRS